MSVDRREVIAENDLIVAFEVMDRIKDIAFRQSFTFCIFLGLSLIHICATPPSCAAMTA